MTATTRTQAQSGKGGANHCLSTPEHCAANPIPGREHIQSTALRSEAWNG